LLKHSPAADVCETALAEYACCPVAHREWCLQKKKKCFKKNGGEGEETSSPLLAFHRGHALYEAEPGLRLLTLTEWGQLPRTFCATTQYFPYKIAEVLIIRIQ